MQNLLSSGVIAISLDKGYDELIIQSEAETSLSSEKIYGANHLCWRTVKSGIVVGEVEIFWNIEDVELSQSGCARAIVWLPPTGDIEMRIYMASGAEDKRLVSALRGAQPDGDNWYWGIGTITIEETHMNSGAKAIAIQYKIDEINQILETTGYIYVWNYDWDVSPQIITYAEDYSAFGVAPNIVNISIWGRTYCTTLMGCEKWMHLSNILFTTYESGIYFYEGKGYPPYLGDLSEYLSNQSYTAIY